MKSIVYCCGRVKVRKHYANSGKPCQKRAMDGFRYCAVHLPQVDTTKRVPLRVLALRTVLEEVQR